MCEVYVHKGFIYHRRGGEKTSDMKITFLTVKNMQLPNFDGILEDVIM